MGVFGHSDTKSVHTEHVTLCDLNSRPNKFMMCEIGLKLVQCKVTSGNFNHKRPSKPVKDNEKHAVSRIKCAQTFE